jgi:hypothetical protein
MTEPGQPLRPSYLADSTQPIGGVRIDSDLARTWSCDSDTARQRKEHGKADNLAIPSVDAICTQYLQASLEILKAQKLLAANDKHFDLFVIGGGGRLQPLRDSLHHQKLPGGFVREACRELEPPPLLRDRTSLQKGYDFLANACGLASSAYWDYYPPRDVDSMKYSPPVKPPKDVDELYPK